MKSDVFVVRTGHQYPAYPYAPEEPLFRALQELFASWGRDPRNPFAGWAGPGRACGHQAKLGFPPQLP